MPSSVLVLHLDDAWPTALAALPDDPGGTVHLTGDDLLGRDDALDVLAALDAQDRRALVDSTLPGLEDDRHVRPLAAFDVRFRVESPALAPPDEAERRRFALRNLQAFAYPTEPVVPLRPDTVDRLADTVTDAVAGGAVTTVRLTAASPDRALREATAEALRTLDTRGLNPPPRLVLDGLSALSLPVESLTAVDLRTDEPADAPMPEEVVDPDTRAARRVWLATPPRARPAYRGHPLDPYADAVSLVQLRPPHGVVAIVDRRRPGRRALAATDRFELLLAGRFEDDDVQARFVTLARALHAEVRTDPPAGLSDLRRLAHVLRRSLKPKHDDAPPVLLGEGG